MNEKNDAILKSYNELVEEFTKLGADYRHLHSNFEHLKRINAVLRSRPDLPVDRLPAVEAIEKVHVFLVEQCEQYASEVLRVTTLHKGLMAAADERLDFTTTLLRDAGITIAALEGCLVEALDFMNPAKDPWHPDKIAAFVKIANALLRPRETEFFATAPKPEEK